MRLLGGRRRSALGILLAEERGMVRKRLSNGIYSRVDPGVELGG